MGLGDDYPVGTYPSHGGVIINEGGGFWKGLALAGLTSAGLAGAGYGLFGLPATVEDKKTPAPVGGLYEIEILGTETGVTAGKVERIDEP